MTENEHDSCLSDRYLDAVALIQNMEATIRDNLVTGSIEHDVDDPKIHKLWWAEHESRFVIGITYQQPTASLPAGYKPGDIYSPITTAPAEHLVSSIERGWLAELLSKVINSGERVTKLFESGLPKLDEMAKAISKACGVPVSIDE